ncbi:MAG TPA: glycosyltransferase [Dongiaceae bacterium]|nr:glycosyltransferase [Dongiaceae bacterium]
MSDVTPRISAIIPIFGKAGDLPRLLDHLNRQTLKPYEVILVDASPHPLADPPPGTRLIKNPEDRGLGHDLNTGAKVATGDYLLIIQQDCLPENEHTLEELYRAMTPDRVAVACTVTLPREIWDQYNFWGKVLMARWVGDVQQGISDKFDLYRKDVFLKIGGYDAEHFSAGGQDMDLYMRMSQQGEVYISPTRILHLHNQSRKTGCRDLFGKQVQLAESFGALWRKWGFRLRRAPYAGRWTHHLAKYLYPLLLLLPFWPIPVGLALLVLTNLIHPEAWRIRSPKTLLLLVLNPFIWLAGLIGTIRGLLFGRQYFSPDKKFAAVGTPPLGK